MDILSFLPEAILYIVCGYLFLQGFYWASDQRFNFFSETGFTVILCVGYISVNILSLIPFLNTGESDNSYRNIAIVIICLISGLCASHLRNYINKKINQSESFFGRNRSFSGSFWYDHLVDDPDKPVWLFLVSYERKYILEGVLLFLDEDKENPYVKLGYFKKHSLEWETLEDCFQNNEKMNIIVNLAEFDEIMVKYVDGSSKIIPLNVK